MDSFSFNNLQSQKANTILKHRKLRPITNLLRFVEFCSVLLLVSRFTLFLPVAFRNSSEYFREFSLFVNTPRFVFLIGNLIIITLFAQSGHFSSHQGSSKQGSESDLYQQFVQKNTKNEKIEASFKYPERKIIRTKEKNPEKRRLYQNKVVGCSRVKNQRIDEQSVKTGEGLKEKGYRRCESEISRRVKSEKPCQVLRRCETENRLKSIEFEAAEEVKEIQISYPEDDMSNEEFQRTVEAFIARQQRIRREESYSLF